MKKVPTTLLLIILLFSACGEIKTDNAIESYEYWAGGKPEKDVQVINGKYWESAHWSKEYIVYLELKVTRSWRKGFIKDNKLIPADDFFIQADAPSWFKPNSGYKIWKPSGFSQGSFYLEDKVTGHFFVCEVQL